MIVFLNIQIKFFRLANIKLIKPIVIQISWKITEYLKSTTKGFITSNWKKPQLTRFVKILLIWKQKISMNFLNFWIFSSCLIFWRIGAHIWAFYWDVRRFLWSNCLYFLEGQYLFWERKRRNNFYHIFMCLTKILYYFFILFF